MAKPAKQRNNAPAGESATATSRVGAAPPPRLHVFRALAIALALTAWLLTDLVLFLGGWLAPEDPRVFYARSFDQRVDPFVADGADWTLRPDWVASGDGLEDVAGPTAGTRFLLPGFRAARFAREKDPKTLRIFALGGSSTFGLGVGADAAFPEVLERELAAALPERRIEVINLGCPGWSSERVRRLIPRLLELQPDLLAVYVGHNEMLAGHGVEQAQLTWAEHLLVALLDRSPLIAWANHAVRGWREGERYRVVREEAQRQSEGQSRVYDPLATTEELAEVPTDADRQHAVERYGRNLGEIADLAQAAQVPLVFVMPLANRLMPPSLSVHPDGFKEQARAEFQRALAAAQQNLLAERRTEALAELDKALAVSPRYAAVHFAKGAVFSRWGLAAEAAEAFQQAIDLDARTHRITSGLERVLADFAAARRFPLLDLRPRVLGALDPEAAEFFFIDHVHPTPPGHALIGRELALLVVQAMATDARQ
jgi:lysophospholipase L1-like esterase